MNAAATIRDLILSERLLPGSLVTLRTERQAAAEVAKVALKRLGLTGTVDAHGPHAATVRLSAADLDTAYLWLDRLPFLERVAEVLSRAMPHQNGACWRVTKGLDETISVRRVLA